MLIVINCDRLEHGHLLAAFTVVIHVVQCCDSTIFTAATNFQQHETVAGKSQLGCMSIVIQSYIYMLLCSEHDVQY
jgi:hypothetical protein